MKSTESRKISDIKSSLSMWYENKTAQLIQMPVDLLSKLFLDWAKAHLNEKYPNASNDLTYREWMDYYGFAESVGYFVTVYMKCSIETNIGMNESLMRDLKKTEEEWNVIVRGK